MPNIVKYFEGSKVTKNFLLDCINKLPEFDDTQLIEFESSLKGVVVSLWKLRCAILAEAQRRTEKIAGRTKAIDAVAASFGYARSTAYRKIAIWNEFFQDKSIEDRVHPNNLEYFFEAHTAAESWFGIALNAEDPTAALEEAEEKYHNNEKYNTAMFLQDIRLKKKLISATEGMSDTEIISLLNLSESVAQSAKLADNLIQQQGKDAFLDIIVKDLRIIASEISVKAGISTKEDLETELVSARRIKESILLEEKNNE